MAVLFLGQEGVEVSSFHVQEVLRVLTDDINAGASRKISEGDTESMNENRIHHPLAACAFVKIHLLAFSWLLAVPAGLVGLLPGDVQGPHTKNILKLTQEKSRCVHHQSFCRFA